MAAAWACALDYTPPKLTVVLDKAFRTRALIEGNGTFVVQVPTVAQLHVTYQLGHVSLSSDPAKLEHSNTELFGIDGHDLPFVVGCSAWLACKVLPEARNQQTYDLFIGEIIGAWADTRAFRDGHWHFETADARWRRLHYIAGGHFYATGDALDATMTQKTENAAPQSRPCVRHRQAARRRTLHDYATSFRHPPVPAWPMSCVEPACLRSLPRPRYEATAARLGTS